MKAYSELNGVKTYYKLSNYNTADGIIGYECVNEIIVDRLLTILNIAHLHYQLIHADINIDDRIVETWLCASQDFKKRGESKATLEAYYQQEKRPGESVLDFCVRNGWEQDVYQMLVVDYLILNRDRHGANIEVLKNNKDKAVRLAPLFDHGLSFIFSSKTDEEFKTYDVLEDKKVQCFVGSGSTKENLFLIPKDQRRNLPDFDESLREYLFRDIDGIMSETWQETIWKMLRERALEYADICFKG